MIVDLPGGMVVGLRVLLTAMVIRFAVSDFTRLVKSPSKGKCPPLCSINCTPFTHYNKESVHASISRYGAPSIQEEAEEVMLTTIEL